MKHIKLITSFQEIMILSYKRFCNSITAYFLLMENCGLNTNLQIFLKGTDEYK
jgi:hypothetical protein